MKFCKKFFIVAWVILIIVLILIYRYSFFLPKKVDIVIENIVEIEENDSINITKVSEKKSIITCMINEKYISEKYLNNYIFGIDIGKKIDFSVIVKKDGNYYKLKTLLNNFNYEYEKIFFDAYVQNEYLSEDIYLYNNDTNELFVYKGEG